MDSGLTNKGAALGFMLWMKILAPRMLLHMNGGKNENISTINQSANQRRRWTIMGIRDLSCFQQIPFTPNLSDCHFRVHPPHKELPWRTRRLLTGFRIYLLCKGCLDWQYKPSRLRSHPRWSRRKRSLPWLEFGISSILSFPPSQRCWSRSDDS